MKNKFFKIILFVIILLVAGSAVTLAVLSNNSDNSAKLKEKAESQIKYLDTNLIAMANKLNNISYKSFSLTLKKNDTKSSDSENSEDSESSNSQNASSADTKGQDTQLYTMENAGVLNSSNTETDWQYIKSNIENMQQMWTNIIIDLYQLNVLSDDILAFSSNLDTITISAKDEKKIETLEGLVKLHASLPKFMEQFSSNIKFTNLLKTKNNILQTYVFAETSNWTEIAKYIEIAQEEFIKVMNQTDEKDANRNALSKIYVMINEMNNAVTSKSKDIYYIKYKNLMETLDLY